MIKILFLSFYYPPDLSAGSFRAYSLISEFLEDFKGKVTIELITTEPNRYSGYDPDPETYQNNNSLIIHKIRLPKHKGGFADQAISFLYYAIAALKIIKNEKYDLIFATSGRLMTASLGAFISRKNKIPLYLDIRDIFVDTLSSIFISKPLRMLIPLFNFIESLTINQACHVNLVSKGFEAYFYKKYPDQSISFFSNGIDEEFLNLKTSLSYHNLVKKRDYKIITYAGNIGDGQGLHKIIPKLARELGERFHFKVIGGGGRVRELNEALRLLEIKNVELIPPVSRDKLMIEYLLSDILFLHLNNLAAFEKVLPSKLFEYAALEKPILAGVSGYAKSFIESEIVNSQVFSPCDIKGAMAGLEKLNLCSTPRPSFIAKYSRKSLSRSLAEDIMSRCT